MDLFLSWSSPRSQSLANIFDKWIQKVFPTLNVYLSSREITPGERWRDSVGKGLESTSFGIFFLVKENIDSPWINFEAGAISKYIAESNVVPLLHEIKPEELPGPLAQFQAMSINKEGIKRIVHSINRSLQDNRRIPEDRLEDIFEKWYPDFESEYNNFSKENKSEISESPSNLLTVNDQVGQVLNLVRSIDRRLTDLETVSTNLKKSSEWSNSKNNLTFNASIAELLRKDKNNSSAIPEDVLKLSKYSKINNMSIDDFSKALIDLGNQKAFDDSEANE